MKLKPMIALLSALLLLSLTACDFVTGQTGNVKDGEYKGSAPSVSVPEKPDAVVSVPNKPDEAPESSAPDTEPGPAVSAAPKPLSLLRDEDGDQLWQDSRLLCDVGWDYILLDGEDRESYPALNRRLEDLNADTWQRGLEIAEELRPQAEELLGEDTEDVWRYFYYEEDLTVHRADGLALSLFYDSDSYIGGMRPSRESWSFNFDPVTGEELRLEDVFRDTSVLPGILGDLLREEYPDIPFGDDLPELISESLEQDLLTWTLGYQGVRFHFNVYELAMPYVAGSQTVSLWFEESPELFREKYMQVPEQYAVELEFNADPTLFDLVPGDGRIDSLTPFAYVGEYMEYGPLEITVNGQAYPLWDYDTDELTLWLARLGSGKEQRTYLYLDAMMENAYHVLSVYEVAPDLLIRVGELSGSNFAGMFTDPSEFVLHTRTEMLSTQTGTGTYHIDPVSGLPAGENGYYELVDELVLTSLVSFEVTILPDEKKEEIPAGMEFTLLRTDNRTFVDARMADGRECRIFVDRSDWPVTIDGIPREDCFNGMFFAG